MTNKAPDFVINGDLAQAIADYLVTRPYREVAALIAALQQLKPVSAEQPPEKPAR